MTLHDEDKAVIKSLIFELLPCGTSNTCKEVVELNTKISKIENTSDTHTYLLLGLLVSVITTLVAVLVK